MLQLDEYTQHTHTAAVCKWIHTKCLIYPKQEESSDESTIISSQTSTLTRNLGPEALRLNLPLTTEDFEHVIDSDDDEEDEEEEEELEAGQEEVMEEALENAVCFFLCFRLLFFIFYFTLFFVVFHPLFSSAPFTSSFLLVPFVSILYFLSSYWSAQWKICHDF